MSEAEFQRVNMEIDDDGGGESCRPFSKVNGDVMQNILGRLPAYTFAAAACVDKMWNKHCNRILSRPKFSSAMSLKPDLHDAFNEAFDGAFSKPLRPHFVVAYIGPNFSLEEAHNLIIDKLGAGVPVISNMAEGLIGTDVETDKLKEVIWGADDVDYNRNLNNADQGIVLSVGYAPGLKVDVIPLLRPNNRTCSSWRFFAANEPYMTLFDHYVMEVTDFTFTNSGSTTPSCIMMFGDKTVDMKQIVTKLDHYLPEETAIVGDATASFRYNRIKESHIYSAELFHYAAASLVFVRDKDRAEGIGVTEFHVTLSPGLMPFGPQLQTISTVETPVSLTWLSALMVGSEGLIEDCNAVLSTVKSKLGKSDMYIGVTQTRDYSVMFQPPTSITSLSFHKVCRGEMEFILVDGVGIKPGDVFLFYHADAECALNTMDHACNNLRILLKDHYKYGREVFGGFIFASKNRGESFFNSTDNKNTMPFEYMFPGVPVAGMFCDGEIGRGNVLGVKGDQELMDPPCFVHTYSSVYLAMSYVPPPPEPQMMVEG